MLRRDVLKGIAATGAATAVGSSQAAGAGCHQVGACLSLTGGFQTVGRQALAGAKLYMALNGDTVAGKKIELIVREESGVPDVARRVVQEMIVNEKVEHRARRHHADRACDRANSSRRRRSRPWSSISGASITVDRSPYMVRTSFTLGQSSMIMGEWAAKNGSKKVVTLVNDWAPGAEAETAFSDAFTAGGGQVIEKLKRAAGQSGLRAVPAARPRPRARYRVHLFPGPAGRHLARQFVERGLDKASIKIIGPGDLTDDDELPGQGDVDARRGHGAQLFGRAPSAAEQEVRRGIQEGERVPPELHLDSAAGTACT